MIGTLTRRNPIQYVQSLGPTAWWRYGVGLTQAGGFCSAWADQTANGNNLVQGTGSLQPAVQADNSLLFDGVDDFMQATFTLNQPCTVYIAFNTITVAAAPDRIFDGVALNARLTQETGPFIRLACPTGLIGTNTIPYGSKGVACAVMNGASSVIQLSAGGTSDTTTGDSGTNNPGGITLAASRSNVEFSNMAAYEMIVYSAAHDATKRLNVIRYLAAVVGLGL